MGKKSDRREQRVTAAKARDFAAQAQHRAEEAARQARIEAVLAAQDRVPPIPRSHAMAAALLALGIVT